jgi:peroxiredoxin
MNVLRCALLLLACSTVVYGAADPGPQIGQAFAHSLSAPDQTGKTRTVTDLLGTNGLAVFFVRSADWCPFCKGQLVDANRHLQEFRSLGINLVSVSVDEVGPIAAFSAEQKIGYPMLSDPKGAINLSLGIRDTQYPVGSSAFGVPRPTLYVLDARGVVRLRYMEPTFRTRPDLNKVLADIRASGKTLQAR